MIGFIGENLDSGIFGIMIILNLHFIIDNKLIHIINIEIFEMRIKLYVLTKRSIL